MDNTDRQAGGQTDRQTDRQTVTSILTTCDHSVPVVKRDSCTGTPAVPWKISAPTTIHNNHNYAHTSRSQLHQMTTHHTMHYSTTPVHQDVIRNGHQSTLYHWLSLEHRLIPTIKQTGMQLRVLKCCNFMYKICNILKHTAHWQPALQLRYHCFCCPQSQQY